MYSTKRQIVISIGSNHDPERHINLAKMLLAESYPDIRFSPVLCTEPVGMPLSSAFFLNCVAVFESDESESVIGARLKQIEQSAGRRALPKTHDSVSIDIDLIYHHSSLLRPMEVRRPYILSGMMSLGIMQAKPHVE